MTDDLQQPLGDAGMDALVARLVRVEAPDGFAARVRVALDSRESTSRSHPWLRPTLAAAAMLVAVALWWWRQPLPRQPEVPQVTRVAAPARPGAPVAPSAPVAP
ncbi:MAG TPA: hypothetical protein VFG86_21845, partial [Chloroflexota bacterium]|nr:hypothetical protein [Chloroflexota bacterium]